MSTGGVALVTGAGGFIGHHLVKRLVGQGWRVRGADLKRPEYEDTPAQEFMVCDLRRPDDCMEACKDVGRVYHLAADMGGIGYITASHADIAINNTLVSTNMLRPPGRALPVLVLRLRLPAAPAAGRGRRAAAGGGRVPGRSRGGLRA